MASSSFSVDWEEKSGLIILGRAVGLEREAAPWRHVNPCTSRREAREEIEITMVVQIIQKNKRDMDGSNVLGFDIQGTVPLFQISLKMKDLEMGLVKQTIQ